MKKNVKVCFAGASAVLHSQNGNGHRVAPETKKIFEKKNFFSSRFLSRIVCRLKIWYLVNSERSKPPRTRDTRQKLQKLFLTRFSLYLTLWGFSLTGNW